MASPTRLLLALSLILLLAGVAGAASHPSWSGRRSHGPRLSTTTSGPREGTTATTVTATTVSPESGPALASGLVTPTDMGGYYRVEPSSASALLASAPCLAELEASPAQTGRAVTALLGPNYDSVPTIVEAVASYSGGGSASAYGSLVRAIHACPTLGFTFGGSPVQARLSPASLAAVGDADAVWSGSFARAGGAFTVQVGAVLDGPNVLGVIWIDSTPPSPAIMGSFASTISLAIGKLA